MRFPIPLKMGLGDTEFMESIGLYLHFNNNKENYNGR